MSNEPTLLDRVEQAITAVIYAPKIDNTQSIARRMAKVALRLTDTELASLRARVEALQLDNDRLAGESGANLARAEQRAKRLEVKDVRIAELEARVEELGSECDRVGGEVELYEEAVNEHLPEYAFDDGSDGEAMHLERIMYAGDELRTLRARVEELERQNGTLLDECKKCRPFMQACVAVTPDTWERTLQLLSATTMALESAEYRDSENATIALEVRNRAEEHLAKLGRIR